MTYREEFNNYTLQFKEWLRTTKKQKKNTISSRISNIRVIGEHYDILKEFAIDECQGIFDDLQYSTKYDNYVKYGCIGKFLQVFLSTEHPYDAYLAMLH